MNMQVNVEISEDTVRSLVVSYLSSILNCGVTSADVVIEVKSKQNYRSEWERASFRARVAKSIDSDVNP